MNTLSGMLANIDLVRQQSTWSEFEQMRTITLIGQRFAVLAMDRAEEQPAEFK